MVDTLRSQSHERTLNKALTWTSYIIIKFVWECVITLTLELFFKATQYGFRLWINITIRLFNMP
jgi:hypothetical protein